MSQQASGTKPVSIMLTSVLLVGIATVLPKCEVVSKEEAHSSKDGHFGPKGPRPRGVDK